MVTRQRSHAIGSVWVRRSQLVVEGAVYAARAIFFHALSSLVSRSFSSLFPLYLCSWLAILAMT